MSQYRKVTWEIKPIRFVQGTASLSIPPPSPPPTDQIRSDNSSPPHPTTDAIRSGNSYYPPPPPRINLIRHSQSFWFREHRHIDLLWTNRFNAVQWIFAESRFPGHRFACLFGLALDPFWYPYPPATLHSLSSIVTKPIRNLCGTNR